MKTVTILSEVPSIIDQLGVGNLSRVYNSQRRIIGHGVVYKEPEEDPQLLSLCSEEYMLIQNKDILTEVAEAFPAESRLVLQEWKGTMNLAVFKPAKESDEFEVGVLIKNSMDGRIRYTIEAAVVKIVCENGMLASRSIGNRRAIWHLEKNRASLGTIMEYMEESITGFLEVYDQANVAVDPSKLEDFLKSMKRKRLVQYIRKEIEDQEPTVQDVYDVITNYASHKLHYNWDVIHEAGILLASPAIISS